MSINFCESRDSSLIKCHVGWRDEGTPSRTSSSSKILRVKFKAEGLKEFRWSACFSGRHWLGNLCMKRSKSKEQIYSNRPKRKVYQNIKFTPNRFIIDDSIAFNTRPNSKCGLIPFPIESIGIGIVQACVRNLISLYRLLRFVHLIRTF